MMFYVMMLAFLRHTVMLVLVLTAPLRPHCIFRLCLDSPLTVAQKNVRVSTASVSTGS